MGKKLLFLVFSLVFIVLSSQQNKGPETSSDLLENIHLHLNKTTFLQGEWLWFKAYVRNQSTKLPAIGTTNLHLGLYNNNGEEVKRKLFYVENGMAQGDFAIDSNMVDSEYTVLAWTNYMRNFKELEPFRQRVTILRDGMHLETSEVDMKISTYPEGGDLIAGAYNTIGIFVDNGLGKGVSVSNLELVDEVGKVINKSKTDMFVPQGTLLPISEGRIIGDTEIKRYNSVLSYLITLGYKRSIAVDQDGFFVDVLLNPKDNKPVACDSAHINLPLSRVQAIYFDVDKKVYVSVVLRSRLYESPEERNKFLKLAIKNGYARPLEYFTPNYQEYNNTAFRNYGTLDWQPNISVGIEVPTSITIPLKNQEGAQLYFEGMTRDGSLISQIEQWNLKKE